MILDRLGKAELYSAFHPRFQQAFDFLSTARWPSVADGRHLIDGENLLVIVSSDQGRGRDKSLLEFHRQYIDIQFVIDGTELIGWSGFDSCCKRKSEYEPSRDIGFFADQPESWFTVPPGSIAIFFPSDAHAPLAGSGPVRKAVVKVAV